MDPEAVDLTYATRLDSEEATTVPIVQGIEFYVPAVNAPCGADLALIRVAKDFSALRPIAPRLDRPVLVGEEYVAVGYGVMGELLGGEGTRRRIDGRTVQCLATGCAEPLTEREFRGA